MTGHGSHHTFTHFTPITNITNIILVLLIAVCLITLCRHCSGLRVIIGQCLHFLDTSFCISVPFSHLDIFDRLSHYISVPRRSENISSQCDQNTTSVPEGDSPISIIGKSVRFLVPTGNSGSVEEV